MPGSVAFLNVILASATAHICRLLYVYVYVYSMYVDINPYPRKGLDSEEKLANPKTELEEIDKTLLFEGTIHF